MLMLQHTPPRAWHGGFVVPATPGPTSWGLCGLDRQDSSVSSVYHACQILPMHPLGMWNEW